MTIAAVHNAAWRGRCASETLPSAVGDKSFCYSIVGALLSVGTPKALGRVQRIEYVISELLDEGAFLDETEILEACRGELSPAGSGEIDLGNGPIPTDRWEAAIEEVPPLEYLIELIALDSEGGSIATSVTVFVPFDPDDASIEYSAGCEPNGSRAVETQGTVERAGGFQLEGEPLTAIFRGSIELAPGPCGIQVRPRDAQGEVIWTLSESFELYFAMVDLPCPAIPPPHASVTPKGFCGPAGGIILSAETPAATSSIEIVRYVLTSTSDIFLEPLVLDEGSLESAGQGAVDRGGGPIETNLWESIPGVVPVGALSRWRSARSTRWNRRLRHRDPPRRAPDRHRASTRRPPLPRALTCDVVPVGG